jgi:hypothetical protein
VDTDPDGLNGRLSPDFPTDWKNCGAQWPQSDPGTWPVVARFYKGTILNATTGNLGVNFIKDSRGKNWIMVRISADKVCFVRANSKFLKPVRIK